MKHKNSDVTRSMMIPKSETEALQWLFPLLDLEDIALRIVGNENFKKGWAAIAFLYPGLHPDSALEEGIISQNIEDYPTLSNADPRLLKPYYKESGAFPLTDKGHYSHNVQQYEDRMDGNNLELCYWLQQDQPRM